MHTSVHHKKWDIAITIIVLLLTGIILALLHFILVVLPFNNIIEAFLFFGFGYLFGKKVHGNSPLWGIVLALPAVGLLIYRMLLINADGTAFGAEPFITLLLLPFAASLGMYLRIRYHHHKHSVIDEHFLNE